MINARTIYVALMLIASIALGAAVATRPALAAGAVPPIAALLVVSLIIDICAMALAARNGSEPVSMNARLAGFFGAAALYLLITIRAGVSPGG